MVKLQFFIEMEHLKVWENPSICYLKILFYNIEPCPEAVWV